MSVLRFSLPFFFVRLFFCDWSFFPAVGADNDGHVTWRTDPSKGLAGTA